MTQINALTGAIIQGAMVQQRQSAARDEQVRRAQNLSKDAALTGDQLEHQVESTDALRSIHEDSYQPQQKQEPQKRKKPRPAPDEDAQKSIDLRA